MKRRVFLLKNIIIAIFTSFLVCGCSTNNANSDSDSTQQSEDHVHTFLEGYKFDEGSHWKECTSCHEITAKESHIFDDWKTIKEPSVFEEGTEERRCRVCDYFEQRQIELNPYQKWKEMRDYILSSSSFTFATYKDGELQSLQLFDGNKMQSGEDIYTFGDENYKFYLENDVWYREECEESNQRLDILNWLEHWYLDETMYFIEDGVDILILKDKETLEELYSFITKDSMIMTNSDDRYEFIDINNTKVDVPEDWQIKEPPVVEQMIKNEDGTYNLSLIKSVLTNWLMGDNAIYPGEELIFKWNDSRSRVRAIKAINVPDFTAYIDVYKENGSTFLLKLSITDENILNGIANGTIATDVSLADALREVSWRKVKMKTESTQDMDADINDIIIRAKNALNYLGIEGDVLFAYETGKISTSLDYGEGLDFYQSVFVSNGKLYSFSFNALSKNDVLQNTNKWDVKITDEKQLDLGNVAFYC